MKFDYLIGNPAYQQSRDTTKDMPVYNEFMDAAEKVADKVELITPARFLFNAGATPKQWNEKKLNDPHFKVLQYEPKSNNVFAGTDIKGGVAITYRDKDKDFGEIEIFTSYPELNGILTKLKGVTSLNTIMYPYSTYTLSERLWEDYPEKKARVEYIAKHRNSLSKEEKEGELSNLRIITTNIFDQWPEIFTDIKPCDDDLEKFCCLIGRQKGKRIYKYIKKEYIEVAENYQNYKVIVTAVNGSGKLGEVLSSPFIGEPLSGYTQTFLGIGNCKSKNEAEAIYKYICSKFCRTALGILKITQHNPPEKWKYVPLQDFTSNSDIDWSKSIPEIDQQLYRKYGLSEEEINFIETNVKEMN